MTECSLCPRRCGTDRTQFMGYCGADNRILIARAALHMWEEPCISGKNGSGTIFFSGCPLKCCYCQNYKISIENFGREISVERLAEIMLELQDKGANNINLVTAAPYVMSVIEALEICRGKLHIPIVYNSGGYENVETIEMLRGYIDVYLPDMKYMDSQIAEKYSNAPDYPEVAAKAIECMYKQVGDAQYNGQGMLTNGVIVRHLVLPTHKDDSIAVLEWISNTFGTDKVLLALMSQYTPFYRARDFKEINRKISTYEYNEVLKYAQMLGLKGFMQERTSATEEYTPPFDLEGVLKK